MSNFGFTSGKKKTALTNKWTEREIESKIAEFYTNIEEIEERGGNVEVKDAILTKTEWPKNEAREFPYAELFSQAYLYMSGGASRKMEILFEIILMNIEKYDLDALKKDIATCKTQVDEGADWDKKNKLKIFEAVYCMLIREF